MAFTRIEILSEPDRLGRVHYAKFWMADYHPGDPDGEHRWAERGQHFLGVPNIEGVDEVIEFKS